MAIDVSPERLHRPPPFGADLPEPGSCRFAPPSAGPGTIARPALLRRLREAPPVVVVCAPAGYGKTALLARWAGVDPRRVAWLSLGPEHRDAGELASDILAVLAHLGSGIEDPRPVAAPTALGRIRRAVADVRDPALLVVDDAHLLTAAEGLDAVRMICDGLPAGSQVALGCRAQPALRLGLLRARGLLLLLGPADLAMDVSEAGRMLRAAGADLDSDEVTALVERTEGWPAGLYLGGVAGRPAVEDFLEDEVLDGLTPDELDLLTRTAVLDRLSPPACDAMLATAGTGPRLAALARRGVLVATGAPARDTYRHHRLIGDALRARLARCQPEMVPALHRAASDWLAGGGDAERAIRHAAAAGATELLGELVWDALPGRLLNGAAHGGARMARPPPAGRDRLRPRPGDRGGLVRSRGRRGGGALDRCRGSVGAAGRRRRRGGARRRGGRAARRGGRSRGRGADARRRRGVPRALAGGQPVARPLLRRRGNRPRHGGDRHGALDRLGEGARRAGPSLPWIDLLCRSWLAVIALREGAWSRAETLCERADDALLHEGLGDYASAALAHASAALLLARAGRVDEARRRRALAMPLFGVVPDLAPWRLVAGRALLARASALMGDPAAVDSLLDDAREPLALLGDAPAMHEDVALVREAAEGLGVGGRSRQAPLTAAEARVLRFLPTHHSFREIGEQLHLSRFTIKSQALAIYRKLGVCSRGDAVARARACGLLDDAPPA